MLGGRYARFHHPVDPRRCLAPSRASRRTKRPIEVRASQEASVKRAINSKARQGAPCGDERPPQRGLFHAGADEVIE
jgi:hypothetical protein